MKRLSLAAALSLVSFVLPATAGTIDFDDLAAGTSLNTQYASRGVVFEGSFVLYDQYFGVIGPVSGPNWVDVSTTYNSASFHFVNPDNADERWLASSVSFKSNPVGDFGIFDSLYYTGYDLDGTAVESGFLFGSDGDGRGEATVSFSNAISEVVFFRVPSTNIIGAAPMDNLSFELIPTSTPEPGTMALMGVAGLGAGLLRRRNGRINQ